MNLDFKLQRLQVFLETLSIDVMKVEFATRDRSSRAVSVEVTPYPSYPKHTEFRVIGVPVLHIYVRTTENFQSLGLDSGTIVNYDAKYSKTDNIRQVWYSLVSGESQISNYYNDHMLVLFCNHPQSETSHAILKNENQVVNLIHAMNITQPEKIYGHSDLRGIKTGYRIIYKNKQDYLSAQANGDFETISLKILRLIQDYTVNIDEDEVANFLAILFIHPDMTRRSEWFKIVSGKRVAGENLEAYLQEVNDGKHKLRNIEK